jgi:hypothetical protein
MRQFAVIIGAMLAAWSWGGFRFRSAEPESPRTSQASALAVLGGPKVKNAYLAWARAQDAAGGDRALSLALRYSKGLSSSFTRASGTARFDLAAGRVSIDVADLPDGEFDAWIVDNLPGNGGSVAPQASDLTFRLGRLERAAGGAQLQRELGPEFFQHIQVDLVTIAAAESGPERGLIFGSFGLFQRLYTALRSPTLLAVSDYAPRDGEVAAPRFGISVARAAGEILVDPDVLFDTLVEDGADLFINETFNGNGRTCATCHPVGQANTQLSVSDIEALPDTDPLFVAEFTPALQFTPGGPKFEVPVLMRGAALIVENQDGMDDLVNKFNMRSIPHTLALTTSLTPNLGDGTTIPPDQRTGWSGDGAPGAGTLNDFATGAVTQHFPKTLGRVPGVDFRLPTPSELDAMEAFQLSLGRDADLVLPLAFSSPLVARGQTVFMSSQARCNGCHSNASANVGNGTNRNFNTGVEDSPLADRPTQILLQAAGLDLTPAFPNLFPRDGGFGATPGDPVVGFGNGTFNTPPLVEAADTGPFFHDNQIRTIEGAVAFYNSDAFTNSPAGGGVALNLQPGQVEAIAAFLRALNALENIRSALELSNAVVAMPPPQRTHDGPPLLRRAAGEIDDGIEVLSGADLHPEAVAELRAARALFAPNLQLTAMHPTHLTQILALLTQAKTAILP